MGTSERKIILKNISKSFENKNTNTPLHVLDNVSLDVYENEFLVLFGPGQCGKTVLLNIMAELQAPDTGEVIYGQPQGSRRHWRCVPAVCAVPLENGHSEC